MEDQERYLESLLTVFGWLQMLGKKPRLTADPSIGVADLMEPKKSLLERSDMEDFNLVKALQPPGGFLGRAQCLLSGWQSITSSLRLT